MWRAIVIFGLMVLACGLGCGNGLDYSCPDAGAPEVAPTPDAAAWPSCTEKLLLDPQDMFTAGLCPASTVCARCSVVGPSVIDGGLVEVTTMVAGCTTAAGLLCVLRCEACP